MIPGFPARMWLYNWTLDRWAIIELYAKAILPGFTTNITLEALDALYPDGLDSMPYSLDDQRFAGGDPLFLVVDNSDTFGVLNGPNMAARFQMPFMEITDGRRARLRFLRPLTDATSGLTATMDVRQRLGDVSPKLTRATLMGSGDMPVRAAGRYASIRFDFANGADWTYTQGFEAIYAQGGAR